MKTHLFVYPHQYFNVQHTCWWSSSEDVESSFKLGIIVWLLEKLPGQPTQTPLRFHTKGAKVAHSPPTLQQQSKS